MTNERNRKGVSRYRGRMSKEHEAKHVWILKTDLDRLEQLAKRNKWLATTGRKAGDVNYQQAINETLKAGLTALGV